MADGNGNGAPSPWWARLLERFGLFAFLVLFLLGAIPGLHSPIDRILEGVERLIVVINEHEAMARTERRERFDRDKKTDELNQALIATQQELLRLRRIECLRANKGDTGVCGHPGSYLPPPFQWDTSDAGKRGGMP